jgi:pimeloyl-ACP methyl ester carboxylesterase
VPYIRGGTGHREAVVFLGANALFRRIDRISNAPRYARHVCRLLPGHRVTILGYAGCYGDLARTTEATRERRGLGVSQVSCTADGPVGASLQEIVRDAAHALTAPPEVVVGISFGGLVAIRLAAEHPDLVKRLVTVVTAPRFSSGGRMRVRRQQEALERGDFAALVRENSLLFRRPWYNWTVRVKLWKDGGRLRRDFRAPDEILRDCRQLFGPDFDSIAGYARRVRCPALVIGGTADQYFDADAFGELSALIPGARVRLFDNETHMLPIERSGDVAAAIREFLERSGSQYPSSSGCRIIAG